MSHTRRQCEHFVTSSAARCSRRAAWGSQYCWHHRETNWMLGIASTFALGAISIVIALYQMLPPVLDAECVPPDDGNPSQLICRVTNSGWRESRDSVVSFTNLLPLGTKTWGATPEMNVRMEEAEAPPDPTFCATLPVNGEATAVSPANSKPCEPGASAAARLKVAFVVKIPRIPPRDAVTFHVATTDPDNVRAAQQVLRIRREIVRLIHEFGENLEHAYPDVAKGWKESAVLAARVKEESFFTPGVLMYESGRNAVRFFTEEEELAKALHQDIYSRYARMFPEVPRGWPVFLAPVIRIRTREGEGTYASFPPYIGTLIEIPVWLPRPEDRRTFSMFLKAPVPDTYDPVFPASAAPICENSPP